MDQPHHVSYVDPKILVSNKCMTIVEQVMVYKDNVTIATVEPIWRPLFVFLCSDQHIKIQLFARLENCGKGFMTTLNLRCL